MSKRRKKLKQTAKRGGQDYDNPLLVWVGVVFFILVSLRVYLMQGGQIGHNWDASLPYLKELFVRIPVLSIYTWVETNLGGTRELTISHLVPNYLMAGLGYVLGAVWAVKVLIVGVVLVGVWGMGRLVRYLVDNGSKQIENGYKQMTHPSVSSQTRSQNYSPSFAPMDIGATAGRQEGITSGYWWVPFAVLYGMSPFLFNEIIGGSWYMWVSYAAIPVWVIGEIRIIRQGLRNRWLLYWLLASIFVMSSMQNFVLMEGIVFLFLLMEGILARKFRVYTLRYLGAHLVLVVVNFYWILPTLLSFGGIAGQIVSEQGNGFLQVKNTSQNLTRIFDLSGYLNRDMYFGAVPGWLRWAVVMAGGVGMGMVVRGVMGGIGEVGEIRKIGNKTWSFIIFLAIFLISILVVKGGNYPFGQGTMELFYNFPLMALYRSPQHLMLAPAFLVPILLAYAYASIVSRGDRGNRGDKVDSNNSAKQNLVRFMRLIDPVSYGHKLWYVMVGIVLVWTSGWWWNGDLGARTLLEQKKDHVDFFKLPRGLMRTYEMNLTSEMDHRIIFLPTSFSPIYLPTAWQNLGQGGQPEYMYLKNPTVTEESNELAKIINRHFCRIEEVNWLNLMSLMGVRYVSLRGDILPLFSDCRDKWDVNKVYEMLESDERIQKVVDGRYTKTYQIKDEYFLPRIYSAKQSLILNQEEDKWQQLTEAVSGEDFEIGSVVYLGDANVSMGNQSGMRLEYEKISPVKYMVMVNDAKEDFDLIFSENFNTNWKVYLADYNESLLELDDDGNKVYNGTSYETGLSSGGIGETWFKEQVVSEEGHKLANAYANSWKIQPEDICGRFVDNCFANADGSYDFELVIEFWNQRLLYLGLLISLLGWVGVLGYVFFKWGGKSHYEKDI